MDRGGAEMRTVELMPLLAEAGVHFDFCVAKPGPGQLDERIRTLGGRVIVCRLKPNVARFTREFLQLLRNNPYDIVHSHGHLSSGFILWLAQQAGIPGRIAHFRTIDDGKRRTLPRRLYHYVMRRLRDRHATAILAVCRGAMEYGWRRDWQHDRRCRIIYNGLDLAAYRMRTSERVALRRQIRAEFGLEQDALVFINVGRFHPPKGHDVLLAAARDVTARAPTLHFLLVGDGDLQGPMQAQARRWGLAHNVHFAGLRHDVPRLLQAADAFVLSSRREGLPGVVLEALAAGLPVVATDLPGVREIAAHTGLIRIVPCEDAPALAREILRTRDDILQGGIAPEPFPVAFDLQRCAAQLLDIYREQARR